MALSAAMQSTLSRMDKALKSKGTKIEDKLARRINSYQYRTVMALINRKLIEKDGQYFLITDKGREALSGDLKERTAQGIDNDVRIRGLRLYPEWEEIRAHCDGISSLSQAQFIANLWRTFKDNIKEDEEF